MAKKLQLTIPEPCHENWDKMTPLEQGRFCASCQKQVVDFTNMSDRQLAVFFKKPILSLSKEGSVCGRFQQDQLDRDMEIQKKRIPWVKYFFQFALPAFLMSAKASAQGKVRVTGDTITVPVQTHVTLGMVAMPTCEVEKSNIEKIITGKVVDQSGFGIAGATIAVKGTRIATLTDSAGSFKLNLKDVGDKIVLVTSFIGFVSQEVVVNVKTYSTPQNIQMITMPYQIAGEVVVVAGLIMPKKSRPKPAVPLLQRIFKDTAVKYFKVFPNPISSNARLHIECKKMDEGYYSLQLFDQSGKTVYSKELWIDADARLLDVAMPSVTAGSYFLKLTNKKSGKNFTEKIIIE